MMNDVAARIADDEPGLPASLLTQCAASRTVDERLCQACIKRRKMIIITAPHTCLPPAGKQGDTGCNARSFEFSMAIYDRLRLKRYVELVANDAPRFSCDSNRLRCRQRSRMRKRLSSLMDHASGPFVVIDVHSYHDSKKDFSLKKEYDVVRSFLCHRRAR